MDINDDGYVTKSEFGQAIKGLSELKSEEYLRSKGCCKKKGCFEFYNFGLSFLKKMIDIHFYCQGYGNSKGLAIIQDFTAH